MNSTFEPPDEGAQRLVELFQQLLDALPQGTATLNFERTDHDDGTIVWLKPTRKQAVEFWAHVEDRKVSLLDVSFGAGTTFELPFNPVLPAMLPST
jgi:hypothetical protein